MYSPKRRPSSPRPIPTPNFKSVPNPGSPVTPPISDPSASGLHLLCLAANTSPAISPISNLPPTPLASHAPTAMRISPQPPPPFAFAPPYGPPLGFVAPPPTAYVYNPSAQPPFFPYYPPAPTAVPPSPPMYAGYAVRPESVIPPGMGLAVAPANLVRQVKGPWRKEEDELLTALVARFGARRWTTIAAHIPGRTGKQARERWLNQLSPDLAKRAWSASEDRIVMEAHGRLGNRWSEIAKLLKGRTDNAVKNRFNTTIRRQIAELSPVNTSEESVTSSRKRPLSPTEESPAQRFKS